MTNLQIANQKIASIVSNHMTPIIGSENTQIVLSEIFRYGIASYRQKNQILTDLIDTLKKDFGLADYTAQSVYDHFRTWPLIWEGIDLYGAVLKATESLSEYEDQMAVADLALGRYKKSLENVGRL